MNAWIRGWLSMSPEKLVYMANQIGKFFHHEGEERAAADVADHLAKFWDPRMRKAIIAYLDDAGGAGLDPAVLNAVERLKAADQKKSA